MEIIQYSEIYFDQLLALDKECFGIDCREVDEWQEIIGDTPYTTIYLAVENGRAAAFLSVYNWGQEKNYVKIIDIGTGKAFRGRGLAHRLLETMMAEMEGRGMYAYAGETRVSNFPMQKVFEDFGFQNVYTMENYYDDPTEDALRYHLIRKEAGPIGW